MAAPWGPGRLPGRDDRAPGRRPPAGRYRSSGGRGDEAHAYFVEAIRQLGPRATRRTRSPRRPGCRAGPGDQRYLRAVVIHLDPGDNAQGIFETLNHRGAPLLAADLIKNLVFRIGRRRRGSTWSRCTRSTGPTSTVRTGGPTCGGAGRSYRASTCSSTTGWSCGWSRRSAPTTCSSSFREHLLEAGPRVEDVLAELARDARTYAGDRRSAGADTVAGPVLLPGLRRAGRRRGHPVLPVADALAGRSHCRPPSGTGRWPRWRAGRCGAGSARWPARTPTAWCWTCSRCSTRPGRPGPAR